MGAVLAANLAGYKGKVTKSKSNACGFGAVITRIFTHVGVDRDNHRVSPTDRTTLLELPDVISLVSKEFIAGPHSRSIDGPASTYSRTERRKHSIATASDRPIALLSRLQLSSYPATALVDKPSFFMPKYQTKGKAVVDDEGEDEAAQAIPHDSQPHHLLPSTPASTNRKSFHRTPLRANNNIGEIRA
ncbi:hypothetical protein Bca4012_000013 [Brassica carinata]